MTASLSFLGNALGWTLVASLWQSLLVFAVLRLLLFLLRDTPARIRYNLSVGALGVIFLWFLATFNAQWHLRPQGTDLSTGIASGFLTGTAGVAVVSVDAPGRAFSLGMLIPWLDGLYFLGLLVFVGRMVRDLVTLVGIRYSRRLPFDPAWENYLNVLTREWKLKQKVRLYLSERIDIPVVVGYLKPVIYLPFSMVSNLTGEQIEAILLHELAHVRRMDYLVNILQTVVETLLFFNPLVWWISRNIRQERENGCDDLVLSHTEAKVYAGALLALEENRMYTGRFVLAARGERHLLFYRIKRIMEMKTKKLNAVQKLLVLFILAGSLVSVAWLAPQKKPEKTATTSQTSKEKRPPPIVSDTVLPTAPGAPKAKGPIAPPPVPDRPPSPPPPKAVPPVPPVPPARPASASGPLAMNSLVFRGPLFDSLPDPNWQDMGLSDTAMRQLHQKISRMFQGSDWDKYTKEVQQHAANLQRYYSSMDWEALQNKIEEAVGQMSKQLSFQDWQKFNVDARASSVAMKKAFNSDAWKSQMDSVKLIVEQNRPKMDSLIFRMKQQMHFSSPGKSMVLFSDAGRTVRPDRIPKMLQEEGLVKNDAKYDIRINDKGLFINGKKQDAAVYKKYRDLVGTDTNLEIKKDRDNVKTIMNTRADHDRSSE